MKGKRKGASAEDLVEFGRHRRKGVGIDDFARLRKTAEQAAGAAPVDSRFIGDRRGSYARMARMGLGEMGAGEAAVLAMAVHALFAAGG